MLLILLIISLAAPSTCAICKTLVKKGLDLARKGEPLKKVNSSLLLECRRQTNFLIKAGCQVYVKKHVSKLYKEANNTNMTPLQICQENKACEAEL